MTTTDCILKLIENQLKAYELLEEMQKQLTEIKKVLEYDNDKSETI